LSFNQLIALYYKFLDFTNGAFQIHPFILISPCLLSGQIHLLTEIYATGGLTLKKRYCLYENHRILGNS
jgi:hypothetical protein